MFLTGSGTARATGTGTLGGKANLRGEGIAVAAGSGYPKRKPFIGTAQGEGVGYLTWQGEAEAGLQDAWFYGTTPVRKMLGIGAARAEGSGVLA